ncbi:EAL domain-containing protein [Roseobacter sinensis]|uniref:EAL domain-containing protein n=1 Tax=Roseobacter sinensis TaxID=2931391 RepID=A0ABT3BKZ6_9RHOB|nr:EAL domain-containing protein [Roseobacter sp. WL0113]MCV3274029.1 EAL domain-containing protein [Roseobacter sp. WL0113]
MQLSDVLNDFLSLTQDAVGIGYRGPSDETARLIYVNPAYGALFGYDVEEVLGRPVDIVHDPDSWDEYVAKVAPLFQAGKQTFQVETTCIRADGSKFWASISFFAFDDEERGGRYSCATFRDISDLKAREDAAAQALKDRDALLAEQERMYRELLATQTRLLSAMNAYPDPFVIYDREMRLVVGNTAYKASMSTTPEAIKPGMHIRDVMNHAFDCGRMEVPPQGRSAYLDRLDDPDRIPIGAENIELPGDIHHRILRSVAENGDWVVIRLDISEIVRERRHSTEMHARTIAALNAYPDPFAIYDADERLVMWNDAFTQSMTDTPYDLQVGMTNAEVQATGRRNGRPSSGIGGDTQSPGPSGLGIADMPPHTDLELPGDRHRRVLRSQAPNGDFVVIQLNTTELVRQRRAAEALQERLLAAISAYPAPFCIYDSASRLAVWNDSYAQALTDDPNDLREGMPLEEVMRTGLRNKRFRMAVGREEDWLQETLAAAKNVKPVEDIELDGDRHHRLLRSKSRNGDLVVVRLDTTELVRQRRALEKLQDRLISAINAFPDPFSIYDNDLNLVIWNPAFAASLTDQPDQIVAGMNVADVIRLAIGNGLIPAAEGREEEWLASYVSPEMVNVEAEDFEFADDTHYRIIRSRSENGETLVLRLNMTETVRQRRALETYAKQLEEANQQITFKALHDQLTGLGNRRYLSEKFEELSRLRRKKGGELAALHVDLDRFKQINDTIGHAAGDHVLIDVARRISANVRGDDVVARIGGDEFVILLRVPEDSTRPEHLADALLADLARPTVFEGRECRFGASIGVARTPLADEEDLLTNSDVALYKAKRAGRGQVAVFDRSDIEEMRETKRMADEIMRALEQQEFMPHYQPQICSRSGAVVGVEALARWSHPTEGILMPDSFLGVATDLNVVADIDRMIFERAIAECETGFHGLDQPPNLSFNISANRLQFEEIAEIGRLSRAYSGEVAFELLETIFLEEQSDAFMLHLDQLREMGIALEVDDFGSGRASIVALQRIAPDRLKIDRRLISPIAEGNNATRLVKSIIDIGYALDIDVIAEGVETAEQARILRELGAGRLQGYFFSRPLDLEALVKYLKENSSDRHRR